MVLKNDPRAVLDMLSKPVDVDEDEFLDNLDSKTTFAGMADHPTEELNVGYVANEAQEQMLQDSAVETEHKPSAPSGPPVELTEREQRFYNLYQSVPEHDAQGSVPDNVDMAAVNVADGQALPQVGDSEAKKLAKLEDQERRSANIALLPGDRPAGAQHDRFVAIMDSVEGQR